MFHTVPAVCLEGWHCASRHEPGALRRQPESLRFSRKEEEEEGEATFLKQKKRRRANSKPKTDGTGARSEGMDLASVAVHGLGAVGLGFGLASTV